MPTKDCIISGHVVASDWRVYKMRQGNHNHLLLFIFVYTSVYCRFRSATGWKTKARTLMRRSHSLWSVSPRVVWTALYSFAAHGYCFADISSDTQIFKYVLARYCNAQSTISYDSFSPQDAIALDFLRMYKLAISIIDGKPAQVTTVSQNTTF